MRRPLVYVAAALFVLPFVLGGCFLVLLGSTGTDCTNASVEIDPTKVPPGPIAGYNHNQLVNAAYILAAGNALGLNVRDQTIGVMTAMGESALRILDYGDTKGPDSRGLFQQRGNGAWGSYSDRMDPWISSTNFFKALMKVKGRESLEPTIVAHRVQINENPWHYARYWPGAVQVVEYLAGRDVGLSKTSGSCSIDPSTPSVDGWTAPAAGPITSPFGPRRDPVSGRSTTHLGVDLAGGGDGGPIWAAANGKVIFVGTDKHGGWQIDILHQGGITTRYKHMWASGVLAREGQTVTAGQAIGRVGSSGYSTGPHLHFAVLVDGVFVNPVPFLAKRSVNL